MNDKIWQWIGDYCSGLLDESEEWKLGREGVEGELEKVYEEMEEEKRKKKNDGVERLIEKL